MDNSILHNDRELFRRIASGDHAAFATLIELNQDQIFSRAMAFLKDAHKAQDIVQEVFLSIWNIRRTLDKVDNPKNYLFITARNKIAIEFKKKVHSSIAGVMGEMVEAPDLPLDQQMENKELLILIQQAINLMPPQRKQVFELGKKNGLKYGEIARLLHILADVLLMRAEALAQTNKVSDAVTDVFKIRSRAGLVTPLPADISAVALLDTIGIERKRELAFEAANRWFDLNRTGKTVTVLKPIKADFEAYKMLLPYSANSNGVIRY